MRSRCKDEVLPALPLPIQLIELARDAIIALLSAGNSNPAGVSAARWPGSVDISAQNKHGLTELEPDGYPAPWYLNGR